MSDLSGRTVVVVGAAGALGGGIASAFRAVGAHVVGLDRAVPSAKHRVDGVDYRPVDVLDDGSLAAAFGELGRVWSVANVVGGYAPGGPLTELDPDELLTQLQLNLVSAALVTKHALRVMTAAGEGRLVHTASRVALETKGSGFAYSVSKAGVLHLVRMAAEQTQGTGITVNAVVPSIIDTPANRAAMPNAPHERWPTIAQVAQAFVFLASEEASLVSGASVPVYGLV